MAKIKKLTTPYADKVGKHPELIKPWTELTWYSCFGKQSLQLVRKLNIHLAYDCSYLPKRNENYAHIKQEYNCLGSLIHNHHKKYWKQLTRPSAGSQGSIVIRLHRGIGHTNEKDWFADTTAWVMPNAYATLGNQYTCTKQHARYDSIHAAFWERYNYWGNNHTSGCQDLKVGRGVDYKGTWDSIRQWKYSIFWLCWLHSCMRLPKVINCTLPRVNCLT